MLTIRPIEGNFAKDKDLIGKMDPFCEILIGEKMERTKTHDGGGKTPNWNDKLEFELDGMS